MLILSLDTSSPAGSIAVLSDHQLIGVLSTVTEETFSSRIFRQLDFLLSDLRLTTSSFDLFAVNAGPGSFTGLRVGLTAAKAWAEAFSKPVVAVSGLEAVAKAASISACEHLVPAMDARRGQLYVGHYRRLQPAGAERQALARICEDAVMSPAEFRNWLSDTPDLSSATVVTPSPSWLLSVLAREDSAPPRQILGISPVLAPVIGQLALAKSQRGEAVDALRLDANYVRRSDAELNWKGK